MGERGEVVVDSVVGEEEEEEEEASWWIERARRWRSRKKRRDSRIVEGDWERKGVRVEVVIEGGGSVGEEGSGGGRAKNEGVNGMKSDADLL